MTPRPRPGGTATARLRAQVLELYGAVCHLCREPIPLDVAPTHPLACQLDHLIPHADGGLATLDNLRPAHAACNNRRGLSPLAPPTSAASFFKSGETLGEAARLVFPPAETKTAPEEPAGGTVDADAGAPHDITEWIS